MFNEPNCYELVNSKYVLSKAISGADIVRFSVGTYNRITHHMDLFYVASY